MYISCKPTSLARDLVMLQESGYEVKKGCCIDMFPNTGHIETVILLSRKAPDAEIKVRLDMSELDITSAESKAKVPQAVFFYTTKAGITASFFNARNSIIHMRCLAY